MLKHEITRQRCEFCKHFRRASMFGKCHEPRSGKAGDRRGDDRLTTQDSCAYFEEMQ